MTIEIPGYEITETIGKGGMAEVFLARQEALHRVVALKVLFPAMANDPDFGERFLRETRIIASLPHPNIVPVYDAGVVGKYYYLAMEFLKGGCLSDRIEQGLNIEDAIQYTLDIAEALSFAHEQGFIHRDIKPDNVLFRTQAKNAVLSDFGIARSMTIDNSLTQANLVIGTPKYMSPQQALGEPLNEQSDIFSLGIIFFEMLSGQIPYKATSIGELCVQHRTGESPTLPPHMHTLQPIINKALAFELNDRYTSAAELIEDLTRIKHKISLTGMDINSDGATVILPQPHKKPNQQTAQTRTKEATENQPARRKKLIFLAGTVSLLLVLSTSLGYYIVSKPETQTKIDIAPTTLSENQSKSGKTSSDLAKPLPLAFSVSPPHAIIEIQSGNNFTPYHQQPLLPGNLILRISSIGYVSEIIRYHHPNNQPPDVQLQPVQTVSPLELTMYQKAVETKDRKIIERFKKLYPESPFNYVIDYTSGKQTIENIRDAAETGDVVACASLAEIFDSPSINKRKDALHWSSLAAQANFPLGQTQYALILLNDSNPGSKNIDLAINLLKQASQSGFYLAKSSLAELYLMGKYVSKDVELGVQILKEAAELADPYANETLAKIYDSGYESIKPNLMLAQHYKEESDRLNRSTF